MNFKRLAIVGVVIAMGLLGLWLVATQPPTSNTSPSLSSSAPTSAEVLKPEGYCKGSLGLIEEEMARRLEAGKSIKHDEKLLQRLRSCALSESHSYPYRIWLLFFDESLLEAHTTKDDIYKPSPRDREAFKYLTEVLDPVWVLRAATIARNENTALEYRRRMNRRENVPPALHDVYDLELKRTCIGSAGT